MSRQGTHSRARRSARRVALCTALAICAAWPATATGVPPDAPAQGTYVTDGPVRAITHAGGRTYIGGEFTRVGKRTGPGVVMSPSGALRPFPQVVGGDVRAAISDGSGGWYIGGTFTSVGGHARIGLAHVNADGSVDPAFRPKALTAQNRPAEVNVLLLDRSNDVLYVGGLFWQIDEEPHQNVAALRPGDGAPIPEFGTLTLCNPSQQPACLPAVHSLDVAHVNLPVTVSGSPTSRPQPLLFLGGTFTQLGPADPLIELHGVGVAWGVGAVDSTNSPLTGRPISTWKPAVGLGASGGVVGAGVHDVEAGGPVAENATDTMLAVYLSGWNKPTATADRRPLLRAYQFRITNRTTRAVNADTRFGSWGTTEPSAATGACTECAVRAIELVEPPAPNPAGKKWLYFGGDFTHVAGSVPAAKLGRIDAIPNASVTTFAATATAVGAGASAPVRSLAWSPGDPSTLLAGGLFAEGVVALDTNPPHAARSAPSWEAPRTDTSVDALAHDSTASAIYAGGDFRSVDSRNRAGLAAFDSAGQLVDGWAPIVSGPPGDPPLVHSLAASNSTLYVGGRFSHVAGEPRRSLAGVDASSGAATSFNPSPAADDGAEDVLALSLAGTTLYVGGAFDSIGGHDRANLAALDAGSGAATGWNPGAQGLGAQVHAVLPACGQVYVGGRFNRAGGQERANVAAIDPATSAATGWNPDADAPVLALARYGPTIYAGGLFGRIGEAARQKVAGLSAAGGHATAFNPAINAQTVGASVRALAVSDSAVYLGGRFANVRDEPRANLASADPSQGTPTAWNPAADATVYALALGDGAVYAGGTFESLGAAANRGLAAFGSGAGSPFSGDACLGTSGSSDSDTGLSELPAPTAGGTPPPPANAKSAPPAQVSAVAVTPPRLRMGARPLTIRFTLSRAARVRLRFERRVVGRCPRRRGARNDRRRRCVRYVRFAEVVRRGKRGRNRVSFRGQRVRQRRLVRGRYRVKIATLPLTRGSSVLSAKFEVVSARRR